MKKPKKKTEKQTPNLRICPVGRCPGGYCSACIYRYGY